MNANITLRSCRAEDVGAVLDFWKRAGIGGSLPDTAEALLGSLEHDAGLFVIAESGTSIIGTLIGGWDGWRGNMYRLAVEPSHRRSGLGRALVREVEWRLRAKGARRVTALVLRGEDDAKAFWTALGYAPDPTIQRHVRNL